MKTYSSRSTAKRGAIRELAKKLGRTQDEVKADFDSLATIDKDNNGAYLWAETNVSDDFEDDNIREMVYDDSGNAITASDAQAIAKVEASLIERCGVTHCPKCGIHLDNGMWTFDEALAEHNDPKSDGFKGSSMLKHDFWCMGCGEEWGNKREIQTPAAPAAEKETKRKIEFKEKSSVERPTKLVWDIADKMRAEGAKRKDVIEACVKAGIAYNTARTQYQQWFTAVKNSEKPA